MRDSVGSEAAGRVRWKVGVGELAARAKALSVSLAERRKAEALGYLEAAIGFKLSFTL